MSRGKLYSESRELIKSRVFTCMLYLDSEDYDIGEVLNNAKLNFVQYAYIVHDSDTYAQIDAERWQDKHPGEEVPFTVGTPKKSHIHLVVITSNATQLGLVASLLGIRSNYVEKVKNKIGAFQYLVHKNNPEKFQYDASQVVTNIEDFAKKYLRDEDGTMKASKILEFIQSTPRVLSITEVSCWCIENYVWDEFRRGQHIFSSLIFEHNSLYKD